MANANSIADAILAQNNGQPLTLAATTSIHQSFQKGGAAVQLTIPNPMAMIDSGDEFPGRSASGLSFLVRAIGLVTGGERYQIDINLGTGLTQTVASTGLAVNGLTADNWALFIEAVWDPTSLLLRGVQYGWAGNQAVSYSALSGSFSPANLAALTFNVAVTIANANANALFTLTDFSADLN
jgi:hypothetical protein